MNHIQDRIKEIYLNHINSKEFFERSQKADVDISWLERIISIEDFLKLEEDISSYHLKSGTAFFESGFIFAWELFKQCEKSERKNAYD